MKYKLRKNKNLKIILVVSIFISLIFTNTTSFFMQKLNQEEKPITSLKTTKKEIKKSEKIDDYIKSNQSNLISETVFNKEVVNVTISTDNRYTSSLFDYESGEKLSDKYLIKESKMNDFKNLINTKLNDKYPKFVVDGINNEFTKVIYDWQKSNLNIYYYDVVTNPVISDELYIKINYSEIKDYFKIPLDSENLVINEVKTEEISKKKIAITFDDGPGAYTNHLLDVLTDNKAKVTFFMLGKNISYYKEVVKKADALGMEIAYHSYKHDSFKRQSIDTINEELNTSNEILKSITGKSFQLIRPPYGAINADIKQAIDAPFILWSVDTEDWRHKDVNYLVDYTMNNIKEGDIILFHDIHKTSVEAIEILLPKLYAAGYEIVTVSDLASSYNTSLEMHNTYRYFTK